MTTQETIPQSLAGERIDWVVAALTGLPRTSVVKLISQGAVLVDGEPPKIRSQKVAEGQILHIDLPDAPDETLLAEKNIVFDVVYEDEHVIVVDKPAGLIVHPGNGNESGTLVHGLLERFADLAVNRPGDAHRPGIVHRLDGGTSGLLVVARTEVAYSALVEALKTREVKRVYLSLVWGDLQPDKGIIDAPIGRSERNRTQMTVSAKGRVARTHYEVLSRNREPSLSLMKAQLETGRTHQIRVHLAAIGHPVVGDRRYRGLRQSVEIHRPFLHSHVLQFLHPVTGKELSFQSPLPEDLTQVLQTLEMPPPDSTKADSEGI